MIGCLLADTCLAACGHVFASSQSFGFILSLRLYSRFITSRPVYDNVASAVLAIDGRCTSSDGFGESVIRSQHCSYQALIHCFIFYLTSLLVTFSIVSVLFFLLYLLNSQLCLGKSAIILSIDTVFVSSFGSSVLFTFWTRCRRFGGNICGRSSGSEIKRMAKYLTHLC